MKSLYHVLQLDTLPSIRSYIEIFVSIIIIKFPNLIPTLVEHLEDINSRAQYLASMITLAGNYLLYCPDDQLLTAWQQFGPSLLQYTNIHQFAIRSIAQLFLHAYLQRLEKIREYDDELYQNLINDSNFNLSLMKSIDEFLLKSFSVVNWMTKFQDIINVGIYRIADPDNLLNNVQPEGEENPYSDVTPEFYFKNVENDRLLFYSLFGCLSTLDERSSLIRIK
jgi:hypothetical protein